MKRALLVALTSLVFAGCAVVREPAAGPDAPPPAGYAPIFVQRTQPYHPKVLEPFIYVSRAYILDTRTVRVHLHVLDSTGVLYTNIGSKEWNKLICEVTSEINGRTTQVKYRIAEVTSASAPPHAITFVLDHSGWMG
mgnify:FL=1